MRRLLACSDDWRVRTPSLWCLYELWLAKQRGLPWDVVCSTGAIATSRPFANAVRLLQRHHRVTIAENLAHVNFRCQDARCHPDDKQMLLARIAASPGGIASFDDAMTAQLKVRVLSPLMRHAAYMDAGRDSLAKLRAALSMFAELRSRGFISLQSFRGAFGETALRILAARRELDEAGNSDGPFALMLAVIDAGFGVNDQDDQGETPLHWAAFAGAVWATGCCLLRHAVNRLQS